MSGSRRWASIGALVVLVLMIVALLVGPGEIGAGEVLSAIGRGLVGATRSDSLVDAQVWLGLPRIPQPPQRAAQRAGHGRLAVQSTAGSRRLGRLVDRQGMEQVCYAIGLLHEAASVADGLRAALAFSALACSAFASTSFARYWYSW